MGFPKQLVIYEGEPLIKRTARAAIEAGARPVIVVLGANADTIAPALSDLPVTTVLNPAWSTGLASSLVIGVSAAFANPSCDGVLVTLADQPLVDAGALRRLIDSFDRDHRIVASEYDGVIGVPALFGREYLDDLAHLSGDSGAGSWLRSQRHAVTRIPLREATVDMDSVSDIATLNHASSRKRRTSPANRSACWNRNA